MEKSTVFKITGEDHRSLNQLKENNKILDRKRRKETSAIDVANHHHTSEKIVQRTMQLA